MQPLGKDVKPEHLAAALEIGELCWICGGSVVRVDARLRLCQGCDAIQPSGRSDEPGSDS